MKNQDFCRPVILNSFGNIHEVMKSWTYLGIRTQVWKFSIFNGFRESKDRKDIFRFYFVIRYLKELSMSLKQMNQIWAL